MKDLPKFNNQQDEIAFWDKHDASKCILPQERHCH